MGLVAGIGLDRLLPRQPDPQSEEASSSASTEPIQPPTSDQPTEASAEPALDEAQDIASWEQLKEFAKGRDQTFLPQCLTSIKSLSAAQCREAIELFDGWPGEERIVLHRATARRWASLDPHALLRFVVAVDPDRIDQVYGILTEAAARELVLRNPEQALATLASMARTPTVRAVIGPSILEEIAQLNPQQAATFVDAHKEFVSEALLARIARNWARNDPRAAVEWAESLSKAHRGKTAGEVARVWSRSDPVATLEWIRSLSRKDQQEAAWHQLTLNVRQLGAETTLRLLNSIASEARQAEVAARSFEELAQIDYKTALVWAEQLPEGAVREAGLVPAVQEWLHSDPAQALNYIRSLPAGEARGELVRKGLSAWAKADAETAFSWAGQMPAGDERDAAAAITAWTLTYSNPKDTTRWLELVDSPTKRNQAIEEIGGIWAGRDGTAAAEWLTGLPNSESIPSAYASIAQHWSSNEPQSVERWIQSLPGGESRDAAIGGFVTTVIEDDPALATAWAAAINNPAEHERVLDSTFRRWLDRDPAAARTWLDGIALTDSIRAKLVLIHAAEEQDVPRSR